MPVNETILCIDKKVLPAYFLDKESSIIIAENEFSIKYLTPGHIWADRGMAETDETIFQIIPYCIISDPYDSMLTYSRRGSETRLHGLYSCGLGGHVSNRDNSLSGDNGILASVHNGLIREISEECGVDISDGFEFKGLIAESESEAGRVHLGMVYRSVIEREKFSPSDEVKDFIWKDKSEINNSRQMFEKWSVLALRLC